jgi:hypothetical protein
MATSAQTITVKVPFTHRHLHGEIKVLGGRFNSELKTWSLPESDEARALAQKLSVPMPALKAPPSERVRNVVNTALDLLNGLRVGRFVLIEASENRVVIERSQS